MIPISKAVDSRVISDNFVTSWWFSLNSGEVVGINWHHDGGGVRFVVFQIPLGPQSFSALLPSLQLALCYQED